VIQRFADVLDVELKVKPMALLHSFPAEITARFSGYTCTRDRVGCSSAGVFRYERNGDVLYLKITEMRT